MIGLADGIFANFHEWILAFGAGIQIDFPPGRRVPYSCHFFGRRVRLIRRDILRDAFAFPAYGHKLLARAAIAAYLSTGYRRSNFEWIAVKAASGRLAFVTIVFSKADDGCCER